MIIKKKIKLIIFATIFVVIAPVIVLYANGVIFSDGWSLLSTGGIYVRSAPIGAEVYLNNKPKDKISFFNRGILIRNLMAGSYDIRVSKAGYNQWIKKIKVNNNMVSDADVFMLPEKIENKVIPKYSINIVDKNGSTSSVKTKNQDYTYTLSLFASTTTKTSNSSSIFGINSSGNLGTVKSPIMNGKLGLWEEKGEIYVQWFGSNETAPKYLCNKAMDCTESKLVFQLSKEPTKIDFMPGYDGVILVSTEGLIFAVQIEDNPEKMIQILYKGKNPDFRIDDGSIYVKDGDTIAGILL